MPILFLPLVVLFMYYVGFITLTKLKIKQIDTDTKTHFLRFFSGFIVMALLSLLILLIRWIITPNQPSDFH